MLTIGLTGSIACGKSVVAGFFKELGAYIINWDQVSRDVVEPQTEAWHEIVDYFGQEVLNDDLTLNRQKLGDIVFNDAEKRTKLEHIIHPRIFQEDMRRVAEIREANPKAILVREIPLLSEIGGRGFVDKIVVVCASEETQIERLASLGLSRDEAKNRIGVQAPLEEKVKIADFVIHNDGLLEDTKEQAKKVFEELRLLALQKE